MPQLFDITAGGHSPEVQALIGLRELIGDCDNWASLCNETVGDDATEKIILGPTAQPWDSAAFNEGELASIFCEMNIYPPLEPEKILQPDIGSQIYIESGKFNLLTRRYARPDEIGYDNTGNDLFMWFLDTVTALEKEILNTTFQAGYECPYPLTIMRRRGPAYGAISETSAQGDYLWCEHEVLWGLGEE